MSNGARTLHTINVSAMPKFQHDCKKCKFVGKVANRDAYVCDGSDPSVILRFGNEDHEYSSFPVDSVELPGLEKYKIVLDTYRFMNG